MVWVGINYAKVKQFILLSLPIQVAFVGLAATFNEYQLYHPARYDDDDGMSDCVNQLDNGIS